MRVFLFYSNILTFFTTEKAGPPMEILLDQGARWLKSFHHNLDLDDPLPPSMLEAVLRFLTPGRRVDNRVAGGNAICLCPDDGLLVVAGIGKVGENCRRQHNCEHVAVFACLNNIPPTRHGLVEGLDLDLTVNAIKVVELCVGHGVTAEPQNLGHDSS